MNKQENWFATKVEVCEMLENIKTLNDKVDKLIKMVDVIDFVRVKETSEFAYSSFRFPSPNSDWSRTPGLPEGSGPEPEVTEVPEVTKLSV